MKILHLEDNRDDADLVRELLTAEWADCVITLVSDEAGFRASVARHDYDLILSDFSLVQFDGIEALKIAREEAPEIPFIFLSGNIGEDIAIDALRAGAQDYVLKDRMKRLITAIQRALRESEERKRLRATEEARARLASTLENSPDFVGMAAPNGHVFYLNRAGRQMLGLADGALPPDFTLAKLHPPGVVHRLMEVSLPAAARDGSWAGENVLLTVDGRSIPVSQAIVAHQRKGAVEYYSTVMRDLSERQQSEALVNGQNQILEMLAGGEPLGETLTALVRFIEGQCNEMICSILLLDDDGQRLRYCAAPSLPETYLRLTDNLLIGPTGGSCGTSAFRRATVIVADIGTDPLWDEFRNPALEHGLRACWSEPIFDVQHRLLGTFAVYQKKPGVPSDRHRQLIDIAIHIAAICLSRHRVEQQLRNQADILNKASDTIIVTDLNDRITFWNSGAERTFGWSAAETVGRQERDFFPPEAIAEINAARKATAENAEWSGEVRLQDRQGRSLIMENRVTVIRDDAGRPQGRLSIATDVTGKKRIEEQFFRAQRLESLGMLAAGIAHDLNNVLAPIMLAAPMLRDHATDPGDVRMLITLEKSAERGAALVRQILAFARGADGEHRLTQTKHLLHDVATFLQETFPKSITLEDNIPADLWPVKANATQLHQVLLNLCVNARDAMPHGGTLTLGGENCLLDETAAAQIEGGRPGAFLMFHIQDTGTGIPPEVLAHIWEPFYTTKETGKGTGLGLSTVRGIVESHGGFCTVVTAPVHGTTFRIYFPAVEENMPTGGTAAFLAPRGEGELVLVVDDEASIRTMCATILSRNGYRVLTAADGADAVALFTPRSAEIRVVITDLSMPNLDGIALAGIIQRLNPAVKILAVSGHGTESSVDAAAQRLIHGFLIKPFRPEVLLQHVHELLHRTEATVG